MSFRVFCFGGYVMFVKTEVTFSALCELSQPLGKAEFSSTTKNRTKI